MSDPALYAAVREAAAEVFDVFGELGIGAAGSVVYLAREVQSGSLVVLKLEPAPLGPDGPQYYLDVARELDASIPDVELRCPRCRGTLRQWARFCTHCGLDVSGEAPASGEQESRAALREKVRAATAGQYEFLGDIPRAEGGGLVYFARDLRDGKIVALRLQKDINKQFEVGVTRTLRAMEQKAIAADRARAARPAVTIIQRRGTTQPGLRITPRPRTIPIPESARPAMPNVMSHIVDALRARNIPPVYVAVGAAVLLILILVIALV